MGAVLGILVVLNALFVFALLWGFGILLPTAVTAAVVGEASVLGDLLRFPVPVPAYLALVVGFLGAQLYYGYRRVLAGAMGETGTTDHDVDDVVGRLSMTVEVPKPAVRVVESPTPSCYTVGRFTDATVVVTTGLLDELDATELEAVLAHEVAHIANRDVTLMTVTTLFLEIADLIYHKARLVPRALGGIEDLSTRERLALRWFLPLTVVVYLLVSPLLLVFPAVARWATRTLSHAREYAADEAAARITGKPLALATALVTLSESTPTPEQDLRVSRTQALCFFPTAPVTGRTARSPPELDETTAENREGTVSSWLDGRTGTSPVSGTHPPVDRRVARLTELAEDVEAER
jgi:Zn-dependent protease with chaperone function